MPMPDIKNKELPEVLAANGTETAFHARAGWKFYGILCVASLRED
jgi:hypothetical protein